MVAIPEALILFLSDEWGRFFNYHDMIIAPRTVRLKFTKTARVAALFV